MKYLSLTVFFLLSFVALSAQSSMPAMTDWKMEEQGGHYFFRPVAPFNDSRTFVYEIMPPVKQNGQATGVWFREAFEKNIQESGYTASATDNKKINNASGVYSYATQVMDKSGKTWFVSYVGYAAPNGQERFARVVSSPDMTYFKNYATPAMTHFTNLAKQEGLLSNKNEGGNATVNTAAGKTTNTPATANPKTDDFWTANGLEASQIRGVALHLEYRAGVGGAMYGTYRPYLLLTDGSIYNNPYISPYQFDAAKSKQLEPKSWGTWKEAGKKLSVTWSDGRTSEWTSNWFWGQPAANGEKVAGGYGTISGGGNTAYGGNVVVVSAANITFNKSGQFTFASVGGVSNNGDYGSTAFSNKESAGTYLLNGYSIKMHFNNGKEQQQLFFFYPDSKDFFGIGSRIYTPDDDKKK